MQFTLADGYSLTTLLLVVAGALLLIGLLYRRVFGQLTSWQRWILLSLRAIAILLVVILLFRPVLSYRSTPGKPTLLFLLDKSRSMGIADDESGRSRFQQACDKLRQWNDKLRGEFRLTTVAFADKAEVLPEAETLAKLAADGEATALGKALATVRHVAPVDVAAVVVLSDGIHNMGGNPVDEARNTGVRIHAVGVGASLRSNRSYRDAQVTGISCPDRMLLGNTARVSGSIEAIGLAGRVLPIVLEEDGRKVAETELTLDDVEGGQAVGFDFRPSSKGKHLYTVRVPGVAGERIVENNQRSAVALVNEASIRVLYVEGTLRTEYGAMVDRFLARDPDVEFCALVQTRPNVFLQRTNMRGLRLSALPNDQQTFDRFDVFLLGDIDHTYLKLSQQEMLLRRVRDGAGLIMLGGYHSLGPGGYTKTLIGDALPVDLGGDRLGQYLERFLPMLTPEGARHPIFANIADFFPTRLGGPKQPGLPPLDGCTAVGAARPGATVLAALSKEPGAMPVLAVQTWGKGRTAVFTADTTRKWQQGPEAMDRESPFARFWGQMVRWLAGRRDVEAEVGIEIQTDKASYLPGETMTVNAVVRTAKGQGANHAIVHLAVRGPGGNQARIPMSLVTGPSGHYKAEVPQLVAGHYELMVEAKIGGLALSSEKLILSIGRANLEFERLDLDDKTLAAIAAASGGRYVPLSTADPLIEDLERGQQRRAVVVDQPLYWPLGFWTAFVVVLSLEWLLRRRFHLR